MLPSAIAFATQAGDHCGHHDGHPHLCPWHLPDHGSVLGWVLLPACGAWVASRVQAPARAAATGAELASGLDRSVSDSVLGRRDAPEGEVVVVDSSLVFAATVGLLRPRVFVSRGLRARLNPDEFRAVLAHEQGHARRRDALRLALVRSLWSLVPATLSGPLLTELSVACEEACDQEAAALVGDPLIVADAIVAVSRALGGDQLPLSMSVGFGACATDRRVRRLLDPARGRSTLGLVSLTGAALLVLALAEPLHHATETFLGLLLGD